MERVESIIEEKEGVRGVLRVGGPVPTNVGRGLSADGSSPFSLDMIPQLTVVHRWELQRWLPPSCSTVSEEVVEFAAASPSSACPRRSVNRLMNESLDDHRSRTDMRSLPRFSFLKARAHNWRI